VDLLAQLQASLHATPASGGGQDAEGADGGAEERPRQQPGVEHSGEQQQQLAAVEGQLRAGVGDEWHKGTPRQQEDAMQDSGSAAAGTSQQPRPRAWWRLWGDG
jgi:hypothetical protein